MWSLTVFSSLNTKAQTHRGNIPNDYWLAQRLIKSPQSPIQWKRLLRNLRKKGINLRTPWKGTNVHSIAKPSKDRWKQACDHCANRTVHRFDKVQLQSLLRLSTCAPTNTVQCCLFSFESSFFLTIKIGKFSTEKYEGFQLLLESD